MSTDHGDFSLEKKLGKVFLTAAWVIGLIGLTVLFHYYETQQNHLNQDLQSSGTTGTTSLKQNRSGHYTTPCFINDYKTSCLVDTGATTVAVGAKTAERAGLKLGPKVTLATANGNTEAHTTWLESITFGGIELQNVRAVVTAGLGDNEALLGMSALKNLKITQQQGLLIISYPHQ